MIGRLKILALVAALFYPAVSFGQFNPNVQTDYVDYTAVQPAGYPAGDCPDCYSNRGAGYDYIEERILDPDAEYEPGPLDRFLSNITQNSWIRTEYLLWKITSPHTNKMLGEPLEGVADPRDGFSGQVPNEFGFDVNVNVRVPFEDNLNLHDNNGLRMTYGIPLTFGEVEVSGFILNQASDDKTFFTGPSGGFGIFFPVELVATSYTTDGALNTPPDGLLTYDTLFEMSISTNIWGAEMNLVLDRSIPGEGIKLDPIIGFRYLSVNEEFKQYGENNDAAFLGTPTYTAKFKSEALNNIYGATGGARLQMVHRWFTVGLEPKVTLGANTFKNNVSTNINGTDSQILTSFSEEKTVFTAVGELNAFARVHIHENISLHAGWTYLSSLKVSRADENIRYAEINNVLAARVDSHLKMLATYGLNAGAEIRF